MKFWALLITGAVSPFVFDTTLSSGVALAGLVMTLLCGLKLNPGSRLICVFPLFFLITTLTINQRISQRLPLSDTKSTYQLTGVIGSLPEAGAEGTRFLFLPDGNGSLIPQKIQVFWYKQRHMARAAVSNVPEIRAGERWRLQLVLRPARGRVNYHGVDVERWFFTEDIGALAHVKDGDNERLAGPAWFDLQHLRESVLDKLTEKAAGKPAFRLLAALAVADRRGLLARDREILSATGTGHLLAISGLHIGLAAVMGFYLGRIGLLFLLSGLKQRLAIVLPWCSAWLAAFAYAALSGFGVSTQRALIMLTVATLAFLSRRTIHPLQAWLIAMALVLVADPVAPLRAGFWFSFVAVGVLMMLFAPRFGHIPAWRRMLLAQLGISLLMAPLGMYWFQQASLPGLLANLVAIPVVSFLIVPSILAAMVLMWLPGPLAGWALNLAAYAADWLLQLLDHLSHLQPESFASTAVPSLAVTVLAMLGAAVFMLPRGAPGRLTGLLMMLPLFLSAGDRPGETQTQIDFLDVGQGLSVLLTSRDYLMVYDTGPGNGQEGEAGLDMVIGTIGPMIRSTGRKPDLVVASHADLDHAGGFRRLMSLYPDAGYLASLPVKRAGVSPCNTPRTWMADDLQLRVLHPSPGLPYLGNDSSCVISVNGPGLSLLLSGDISRVVEQRLADQGLEPHAILSVPHHGSSTSSSQALIDAVQPDWVLISAASGNRFGFPRADVIERYVQARAQVLNTAQCGGIRIITDVAGGVRIQSARTWRKAIWRWPAGEDCP
ncbi:MAG TPA: DNA internalization-related competence protein ComEC/Rec2 [Xanthomonadales bacterium]